MIGIIGAMRVETEALTAAMEGAVSETVSGVTYTRGTLFGQETVVATCGVGKVFAALCAETMILRYTPALLINTGVAGTLSDRLHVGDVVISDRLVQHDMDTSPLGDPPGLISGLNQIYLSADPGAAAALCRAVEAGGTRAVHGTIASGDQFIADSARKAKIAADFGAVACEMEGAAIAQVATVNGTPFVVLRAISDGADEGGAVDYPTFVRTAAAASVAALRRFFESR